MKFRNSVRRLAYLGATMSVFLLTTSVAASPVTSRATNNTDAEQLHRIECNNGTHITGMYVDEQYNYGVIDVQFQCSDGTTTEWATKNVNVSNRYHLRGDLAGVEVFEQYGYGVIDFRYFRRSGRVGLSEVGRFTNNPRENRTAYIECPYKAYGAEVYEQSGYGIVDIALLCKEEGSVRPGIPVPNPNNALPF